MSAIRKGYSTIKELPSEVRSSFDERDQEKWMEAYNQASETKSPEDAKVDAWMSMVDAPSSLAVETWGSVEVRDADGELVPIKTIEEYADKFIENGGLMHDSHSNVPMGTVWDYEVRKHPETGQDGIVFYFNVYRDGEVFERARDDILSGRKNAVSIGAEAPRGGYKCDDRGCYVERDVTDLYELSICETPANPEAYFIAVGKDIAKSKEPMKGEQIRIGIKDIVVHQDYTTCPLQKAKHDLLNVGFKNIHIKNDVVIAKSVKNEYKLFKAISKMGYPFRYNLTKQQFEIMPDYSCEKAIEEAIENGWAHEDQIGHVCLTKEIPKEVFMDWYDRGFLCKIGDFYCLKADDVAKDSIGKTRRVGIETWARRILEKCESYPENGFDYHDPDYQEFKQYILMCVHQIEDALNMAYESGYINESTKKKVKKDGGAIGVGDAGATNPMYSPKPKTVLVDDKKYGKKRKAKKDVIDDKNIHYPKAKVGKSLTSIEKRCPKGKWKDKKTGECISIEEWKSKYGKTPDNNKTDEETPDDDKGKTTDAKTEMENKLKNLKNLAIPSQFKIDDKGIITIQYQDRSKNYRRSSTTKWADAIKEFAEKNGLVIDKFTSYYEMRLMPPEVMEKETAEWEKKRDEERKKRQKEEEQRQRELNDYLSTKTETEKKMEIAGIDSFLRSVDYPSIYEPVKILSTLKVKGKSTSSTWDDDKYDEEVFNEARSPNEKVPKAPVLSSLDRSSKSDVTIPEGAYAIFDPIDNTAYYYDRDNKKWWMVNAYDEDVEYIKQDERDEKIEELLSKIEDDEERKFIKNGFKDEELLNRVVTSHYGKKITMLEYLVNALNDGAITIDEIGEDFGEEDFEDEWGKVHVRN